MTDAAPTYEDLKLGDRCMHGVSRRTPRGDCERPKAPDADLCADHAAQERERARLAMRAVRKRKRKAKRCLWCPKKAMKGRRGCPACTVKRGRRTGVTANVTSVDRTRLVTEGDGRTRARYIGQGKRGPQSVAANDEQDLADIVKMVERCRGALAFVAAQPDLGRQQRRDAQHVALGSLHLAIRLGNSVLARHRYETPKGEESET